MEEVSKKITSYPFICGCILLTQLSMTFGASQVNLRGAGASFPSLVYKSWTVGFRTSRSQFVTIDANYESVGSGGGKRRIKQSSDVIDIEYAGSDSLLKEEDYQLYPDLQMLPIMAGAVVLAFNIPGVTSLNLTREHIVAIYNGTLTKWNDPSLLHINPSISLPNETILAIGRADKSGTTEIFTKALSSFSSDWKNTYGYFSAGLDNNGIPEKWNKHALSYYGKTNTGMAGLVLSLKYTIGYMSVSDVKTLNIPIVHIYTRNGDVIGPDAQKVQNAMEATAQNATQRLTIDLGEAKDPDAYPIAGYTYLIIHKTTMLNCDSAIELYRYIEWILTDPYPRQQCEYLNMVPLSKSVADQIFQRVLPKMYCNGIRVEGLVKEQKYYEKIAQETWRIPVYIITPIVTICMIVLVALVIMSHIKSNQALIRKDYYIKPDDVKESVSRKDGSALGSKLYTSSSRENTLGSLNTSRMTIISHHEAWVFSDFRCAKYKDKIVCLREVNLIPKQLKRSSKKHLLWLKDKIDHTNILVFLGITEIDDKTYLIGNIGEKGSLCDILQTGKFNLDLNLRFSMAIDLAKGMQYLHSHGIFHGQLHSGICYIDNRWTVKIGDWEYDTIAQKCKRRKNGAIHPLKVNVLDVENPLDAYSIARKNFWKAPEYLLDPSLAPSREGDVYSFAIIAIEIFTNADPYDDLSYRMEPQDIITKVLSEDLRPTFPSDMDLSLQNLLSECWNKEKTCRPNFTRIVKNLNALRPSKKSVMDCMMEAIEQYASQLEDKVEERTHELNIAMQKMETLLHQMLPPSVAKKLSIGEKVNPEQYDSVTVYFSDIVGFTKLSAASTAMQVVQLLNDLYTVFDEIIDKHEVYKVETIGDAYMVVSGCPIRNGSQHASHICQMAMDIATASAKFKIHHLPDKKLELRVGIHSGSVCAGVVGLKMPRYCLFGDTVNTASRMESTSVSMKIQISETTKALLDDIGGFEMKARGNVSVKGKGTMNTYWLHGKTGYAQLPKDCLRDVE